MSEAQLFASMTFPEVYERVLVQPLFRPFAEAVVERLNPAPGDSLIDVACGTGIVARIARKKLGPGARIVAIDVAPPMLAVARTVDASIDWREGNARKLSLHRGRRDPLMQNVPARCMQEGRERDHKDDTDVAHFWESFSLIRPACSTVRA